MNWWTILIAGMLLLGVMQLNDEARGGSCAIRHEQVAK
jgi:hypothetical protein